MSASELAEHLGYLTDQVKLDAYSAALRELITPDSVVLDLGAGTGLLGLLAAQAGARRVYAVDAGPILDVAVEVAKRSGLADRIVHVRGYSTQLDLPEQVDLVVCDQIGGFVHDAGILGYYDDAVHRFLRPGGVLIPASFALQLTPVGNDDLAALVGDWRSARADLDLTPFADAAANTEHRVHAEPGSALGPDVVVTEITSDHHRHYGGGADLPIERAGRLCGLLGTFVAHMSPNVALTNAPWADAPMKRWQNFYPVDVSIDVAPGDRVEATIDVSPKNTMVAWTATIVRADGTRRDTERHDTLRGSFTGPSEIVRGSDRWSPTPTARVAAARTVLDAADGTTSIEALASLVVDRHPGLFVNTAHATSFVRSIVTPVSEGPAG